LDAEGVGPVGREPHLRKRSMERIDAGRPEGELFNNAKNTKHLKIKTAEIDPIIHLGGV